MIKIMNETTGASALPRGNLAIHLPDGELYLRRGVKINEKTKTLAVPHAGPSKFVFRNADCEMNDKQNAPDSCFRGNDDLVQ
jgi:hypothetical protein